MLKALLLRKKIDARKKELEALRAKEEDFAKREAELEEAITEAAENAEKAETDEQKAEAEEAQKVVEGEVEAFETERNANTEAITTAETEISDMERELEEIETEQERSAAPVVTSKRDENKKRGENIMIRDKFFGMDIQERTAFFADEEVKTFLTRVRQLSKRGVGDVSNSSVLIPNVMLPLMRQEAYDTSKLIKHINLQNVPGTARMPIDGGFPEAVWTEMYGTINEVSIGFYNIEVDGYKVSAFVKIANALLEDSDVALASEIISKLGQGVGYALDKAILYGTGTKMPLGIITRLAQTSQPAGYSSTARPWVDLHTSNIKTISVADTSGVKLFQKLVEAFGAASNKFTRGGRFWVMNETTKSKLIVEAMNCNNGAIISGIGAGDSMPVIGGAIETLDFMPDNIIIAGYDGLYLLAQRAGVQFGTSEHVFFVEDQTAYRATARYDGAPVVAEGFVAIGISNTTPVANAVSFAEDTANP